MSSNYFSLHIGINQVDPKHYQGWNGQLFACEHDANFYHDLARSRGYGCKGLLHSAAGPFSETATATSLRERMQKLAKTLIKGDFLLITYSGHGGLVSNHNYDCGEPEDQTWCLPDRQVLDDELWLLLGRFASGVRIVVISDSCHSGTVIKGGTTDTAGPEPKEPNPPEHLRHRSAPRGVSFETFNRNPQVYYTLKQLQVPNREGIGATILLLAACQDHQKALESNTHGLYTYTIRQVIQETGGALSYRQLHQELCRRMPSYQTPNFVGYGPERDALADAPFLLYG